MQRNIKLDVKSANPRSLFRGMNNVMEDLGYNNTHNSVDIQKDAVGDTGFVKASISGAKIGVYKRLSDSNVMRYVACGALLIMLDLVVQSGLLFVMGIGLIILTYSSRSYEYKNDIQIKGDGEVYRGQVAKSVDDHDAYHDTQQDSIISELSISIIGSSTCDNSNISDDINEIVMCIRDNS